MRVSPQKVKIDNFCQGAKFPLTMNPKKPKAAQSKSAGVSLEPDLARKARVLGAARGFNTFSAFVRWLLLRELRKQGGDGNDGGEGRGEPDDLSGKGSRRRVPVAFAGSEMVGTRSRRQPSQPIR
jgi:hypothetical protein